MGDLRDSPGAPDAGIRRPAPQPRPEPVRPFRYPLWIVLFAAAVLAAAGYAALSLPVYVPAARAFKEAKRLDASGDHAGAEGLFRTVLAVAPQSKNARIAMAKALFADGDPTHAQEAMQLLVGIEIDKSDWQELKAVMPPEYQAQFHTKKS